MLSAHARPDLYHHVIRLAEPDYAFGLGPVLLRVEHIAAEVSRLNGEEWVEVRGTEVHMGAAGQVDGQRRTVWVRLTALRKIAVRG
jgi:hypothetical protein